MLSARNPSRSSQERNIMSRSVTAGRTPRRSAGLIELEILRRLVRKHPTDERLCPLDVKLVRSVRRRRIQPFEGWTIMPVERGQHRAEELGLERDEIVRVLRADHGELPLETAYAPREVRRELPVAAARGVHALPPGDADR